MVWIPTAFKLSVNLLPLSLKVEKWPLLHLIRILTQLKDFSGPDSECCFVCVPWSPEDLRTKSVSEKTTTEPMSLSQKYNEAFKTNGANLRLTLWQIPCKRSFSSFTASCQDTGPMKTVSNPFWKTTVQTIHFFWYSANSKQMWSQGTIKQK